jgi:hypothetical protein
MPLNRKHPVISSAVIGGVVGLLVSLFLISFPSCYSRWPDVLFVLWPSAIVGIAWNDPPGFTRETVLMLVILYGGNAFVYAAAASVLTGLVLAIRGLFHKNDRHPLSIKPD